MHPSEDDLILLWYGEHGAAERARLDAHVRACTSCQAAWDEIGETLTLANTADVPEPPDGFEAVMWARVSAALPPRTSRWSWRVLVPAASLAAVVVAVSVSVWSARSAGPRDDAAFGPTPETVAAKADESNDARERALFAALGTHFEQTELLLVELMNAPLKGGDFDFERSTAQDLVASGRLYRATAEQTGHRALVAMLEDLEPVLVEVARSPEQMNPDAVKSIRERIDDESLLFKVRAVVTDARERW
jgi:hypothetical protein